MLTIWGRRNSINVQKAMWAAGQLDLPHERIDIGGPSGGLDNLKFVAMNPMRRVPVIDDGGTVVWESHAIVRYFAARYGAGTLWPEDPAVRSQCDIWIDWTLASLQPTFINGVFWGFYRMPPERQNGPAIARAVKTTGALFRILDERLADRPFIAGETLTMGDIPPGVQLFRYFSLAIERPPLPHVEAWYERLKERPAYREHVMVPFDDLKARRAH